MLWVRCLVGLAVVYPVSMVLIIVGFVHLAGNNLVMNSLVICGSLVILWWFLLCCSWDIPSNLLDFFFAGALRFWCTVRTFGGKLPVWCLLAPSELVVSVDAVGVVEFLWQPHLVELGLPDSSWSFCF